MFSESVDDILDELNYVKSLVATATEWGLEAEVVTFALKYMKENPDLSISDAIESGYIEWIK